VQGRFESVPTLQRRWSEYELDGFNMQLDLDLVKSYDKEKIKIALKQVADNLDRAHDI
jgi:hypothetical protein